MKNNNNNSNMSYARAAAIIAEDKAGKLGDFVDSSIEKSGERAGHTAKHLTRAGLNVANEVYVEVKHSPKNYELIEDLGKGFKKLFTKSIEASNNNKEATIKKAQEILDNKNK